LIVANSPAAVQAVKPQIGSTIAEHVRARETVEQELDDRVRSSPHLREGPGGSRARERARWARMAWQRQILHDGNDAQPAATGSGHPEG
jgi:hypothetical protein